MNPNQDNPNTPKTDATNSPEVTPRRGRSNITPVPSAIAPKNTPVFNSVSRHSFQGNPNHPDERPTKYVIVNPYNSPIGNPPTPDQGSATNTTPNPDTVNLLDIAIFSAENSSESASSEGKKSDELITISSENKISLQSRSIIPRPEKLVLADSLNNSANPQDADSSPVNPGNNLAGNFTAPSASLLQSYDAQPPGHQKYPRAENSPRRDPGDVPLPENLSRMSLGLTPVSYRSSVFYLAITKFLAVPFIIFLFFIVRLHGRPPYGTCLLWMIVAMLILEVLHGSLLLYGALEKNLGIITLCIWYTLLMGSYTSSVGALGVMTFLSLAHYTLQFFFIFMFVVLVCNIFTVICCDVPVLVCYKQELQGHEPTAYPGLCVNHMVCRI